METAGSGDKSRIITILDSNGEPIKRQNEKAQAKTNTSVISKKNTNDTGEDDKRIHKKYKTTINLSALKEMEGTTASSFLDLARAVILIDNRAYDEEYLALSKERKNDFKRLIEHYAVIDVIGKRKYHIKRVYSKQQREELNELETFPKRDNSKK